MPKLFAIAVAAVGLWVAGMLPVLAQEYPSKPIRIVVSTAPGGGNDIFARLIAHRMEERLKTPVLVENRPGGNTLVAASYVANSPPDGYTLTLINPALLSTVFHKAPPFDVTKAFVPVGSVYSAPLALNISGALPAQNLAEFVAYAKANPGKLNYGTTTGATTMLMEVFKSQAGIDLTKIDYKGAGPTATALIANEVQASFGGASTYIPYVQGGTVRIVAVASKRRHPALPEVPTFLEQGYPGIDGATIAAVMAPAGVPAAVIAKLFPAIREAVTSREMEKVLQQIGGPLLVDNNELAKQIREEIDYFANAARIAKYQPE